MPVLDAGNLVLSVPSHPAVWKMNRGFRRPSSPPHLSLSISLPNGSFPLGGCLYFSWSKSSTHPKKTRTRILSPQWWKATYEPFNKVMFTFEKNLFDKLWRLDFWPVQPGRIFNWHEYLAHKLTFPHPHSNRFSPSCSSFFVITAPSCTCGQILKQLPLAEGNRHWERFGELRWHVALFLNNFNSILPSKRVWSVRFMCRRYSCM